jgi:glycosyltransferase 2 family protein
MPRHLAKILFIIAAIGACYLLYKTWSKYAFVDVWNALINIPATNLLLSLLLAACSYSSLAFNDWLGMRYAGRPLPFQQTALASFTGLSIGHNVGLAALSSGAVRYRFYARWGVSAEEMAKLISFCGVTIALGLATLGAVGLALRPADAAKMTGLSQGAIVAAAGLCAAVPVVYLILSAKLRTRVNLYRWTFQLPNLTMAASQILVGTINFIFVAACLHQTLSVLGDASYLKVATASITANIAAVISHVPGGIGVLEATVVHVFPGAESIAAVLAFRVVYYLIPLVFGLLSLIANEFLTGVRQS